MAHYGTLRDFRFSDTDEATDDIRGAKVYGLNGRYMALMMRVELDNPRVPKRES